MIGGFVNPMVVAKRWSNGHRPSHHPLGLVAATSMLPMVALVGMASLAPPAGALGSAGWLRVGDFSTGIAAADVYVDGKLAGANVAFGQVTKYAQVASGSHAVVLRAAGAAAGAAPLTTATPTVTANSAATILVVDGQNGMSASTFQDDLSAPPAGDAKVRIIHTVGGLSAVNVFVTPAHPGPTEINVVASPPTSPPAFVALPFGGASPYAKLPAGSYDVQLRAATSGQVVLSAHSWPVEAGTVASVVVFRGPQGVTLEVLRDAAGPVAIPSGAMATGAGGMANRRTGMAFPLPQLVLVMLALAAVWLAWARKFSPSVMTLGAGEGRTRRTTGR